ncbi:MAG: ATP-dependent helicase/nuclease subunit A, partial [Candidatus Binatia bacterium]
TLEPSSAALGTVVHAWLDRIARQGLAAWGPERMANSTLRLRRDLAAAGMDPRRLDAGVERAQSMLESVLEDEDGRRILGASLEARSEWPLVVLSEGRVVRSTIDRCFVEDGVRWVVDYKTARPPQAEPQAGSDSSVFDQWLVAECESHRPQLGAYKEAVIAAGETLPGLTRGLPVRTALYYPALPIGGRWFEIDT